MSPLARVRLLAAATAVVMALALVPPVAAAEGVDEPPVGATEPTDEPTQEPGPVDEPAPEPVDEPAPEPTDDPAPEPTEEPTPTPEPTPAPPAKTLYGCYTLPWAATVYGSWSDGSVSTLTLDGCRSRGVADTIAAPVAYAKVSWSPTRYALVTFPHTVDDRAVDRVVTLTATQYAKAGSPAVRTVHHIPTSTYSRYASSKVDRYVRTPDGVRHKLTDRQYEKAGSPALKIVYGGYYRVKWAKTVYFVASSGAKRKISPAVLVSHGSPRVAIAPTVYVKTSYSPVHALVTWPHKKGDVSVDQVVRLTAAELTRAGSPKAQVRSRIPGDSFVKLTIGTTIYHRSQGYLTPVTRSQWRAAGAPAVKTITPSKPMYIRDILIVNKSLALPSTYGDGLTAELRSSFAKMRSAAAADGVDLRIISGFRSYESQKAVYAAKIRQYGYDMAQLRSARPGHSEHQTGMAIDVNSISQAWGKTRAGRWVAANAHRYGFIVRYPEGKTGVTGFAYEPWHLRHVGVEVATHLHRNKLTLDEYLGVPSRY